MSLPELRWQRQFEQENARLKRLLAERDLEVDALRELLAKQSLAFARWCTSPGGLSGLARTRAPTGERQAGYYSASGVSSGKRLVVIGRRKAHRARRIEMARLARLIRPPTWNERGR